MTDRAASPIIERRQCAVSASLSGSDLSPLLQRIYANRNVQSPDEVTYSLTKLIDYRLLKDCEKAADIIAQAIIDNKSILVIGDYDVDGATSTTVVLKALQSFGHTHCDHLVPNRFDFGYGLSPEIVEVAHQQRPDLIITVDNGISSIAGVEAANRFDIPVVITDHHLAGDELPQAAAIVNPNQPGCDFPSKCIAGVGVAFYLMLAVRASLRSQDWFSDRTEPNMAELLDLVALGTVADVVPLDANNRIMVDQGLRRIRADKCCAGIKALLTVAGKSFVSCSAQDFGFVIGPRLNAAGRLEDMSIGIACLLSTDRSQAMELAKMLDDINKQRRNIEADMLAQANALVDELLSELADEDSEMRLSLCLYQKSWHEGVVGLLASRLKDRLHRPVIAFALSEISEQAIIKGSARSIPGLHIRDVLDRVDRHYPEMIIKFGGHAMAAGLSIQEKDFEAFQQAMEWAVSEIIDEDSLQHTIITDGETTADELTLNNAEMLRYAGPWGQHFLEPAFDDNFEVIDWRIVGEKHLKMQLRKKDSDAVIDAIAFNKTDDDLPQGGDVHAVYRMDVNEFRGNKKLQLIVSHLQACD